MARLRVSASSLVVAVTVAVAVAVACARGARVVSASRTRHLVISPSRHHASSPSQPPHTRTQLLRYSYFLRRNVAFHFVHFLCTTYPYYGTCTSRRFHFAWPRESSDSRRIIHLLVAWPRLFYRVASLCWLSDLRRIYVALRLFQLCVAQPSLLNRISLFSFEMSHCRLPRRASRA